MGDHTKEPWAYTRVEPTTMTADFNEPYSPWVTGAGPRIVTVGKGICIHSDDMRRIVACVNACAGIPTEVLEAPDTEGQDLARRAWAQYSAVLDVNDDLRAALAKSASREAALVEKLKVAEAGLQFYADGNHFDYHEGNQEPYACEFGTRAATDLTKIKEAS